MVISDSRSLAAACVFLVLFAASTTGSGIATHRKGFLGPYVFLFIFSLIRLVAEICMIVFATLGYRHHLYLQGYIALSVQGFYLLLISTFGRLAHAEYLSFGRSTLNPKENKPGFGTKPKKSRMGWLSSPKAMFTWILVPANALTLAGGFMISRDVNKYTGNHSVSSESVGLRATGQLAFLAVTLALSVRSVSVAKRNRVRNCTASTVSWACLFLVVRAIYGFISCFIQRLNYFNPDNYFRHTGAYPIFTTVNYILGTTMELSAAALLLSSYFIPNQHEYDLTNTQVVD